MEKFIKPWMAGYKYAVNFPEHYKRFLKELLKQPAAVHYKEDSRKWIRNPETGEVKRIENVPIPLIYPKEADEGIWGGEGIIKGFKKKHFYHRRIAHWWIPFLKRTVVYSEILDKYIQVTVTFRTLKLIDDHYGFDSYILEHEAASVAVSVEALEFRVSVSPEDWVRIPDKTPIQDLKSQLALDLKRKMLLTLVRRDMYPNDAEKQEKIYHKYKKFIILEEEAEWFGLSIKEALIKQKIIEKNIKPLPLKIKYRKELFERLKELKTAEAVNDDDKSSGSWFSKYNPFGSRNSSDTSV